MSWFIRPPADITGLSLPRSALTRISWSMEEGAGSIYPKDHAILEPGNQFKRTVMESAEAVSFLRVTEDCPLTAPILPGR